MILVDEVLMMQGHQLSCLDRFLKELMTSGDDMGGKLVVLMIDFRQILTVGIFDRKEYTLEATIKKNEVWKKLETFTLNATMRVMKLMNTSDLPERRQELTSHTELLLQLDKGNIEIVVWNIITVPEYMIRQNRAELQQNVYQNFSYDCRDSEYLSKRVIMASINDIADLCNRKMIRQVSGSLKNSYSVDMCVMEEDQVRYNANIFNNINPSGLLPHHLQLKIGAVIFLFGILV